MRNDVRKLTLCAVLTAAALVTFVIELQLPPLTGIPGIKPGLANLFTVFALCWLGRGWAFAASRRWGIRARALSIRVRFPRGSVPRVARWVICPFSRSVYSCFQAENSTDMA